MAKLVCVACGKAEAQLAPGQVFDFGDERQALIGRVHGAEVQINSPDVSRRHALIVLTTEGYVLQDQHSHNGTTLDDRVLAPGQSLPLRDGGVIELGEVKLRFCEEAQKTEGLPAGMHTLSDAYGLATSDGPAGPDDPCLHASLKLCATAFVDQLPNGPERVLRWLRGVTTKPRLLPIAISYVVDVASLVASAPVRWRRVARAGPAQPHGGPIRRALDQYRSKHLEHLAYQRAVDFIRQRLRGAAVETQDKVITCFTSHILDWVAETWLEHDERCATAGLPSREAAAAADGRSPTAGGRAAGTRYLTGERLESQFLAQLASVVAAERAIPRAVPNLERLLLGLLIRVPEAFKDCPNPEPEIHDLMNQADVPLINACLEAHDLDECDYREQPIRLAPDVPEELSRQPGEHIDIRSIRRTTDLSKLPHITPQDLAVLWALREAKKRRRSQPSALPGVAALGGSHLHFAHGGYVPNEDVTPSDLAPAIDWWNNEGFLIWERQDYEREVTRERYLVAFIADIGDDAQFEQQGISASTHARRLIFDSLRDIAMFFSVPGASMDIHIFLEPVRDQADNMRRIVRCFSLDALQRCPWGERYDYMLELEVSAPGYFLRRALSEERRPGVGTPKANPESPAQFVHRIFDEGRHEFTLLTFLGPHARSLQRLLPPVPPARRTQRGVKDRVKLATLDMGPSWLHTATADSPEQASVADTEHVQSDDDFRYSILEELLGPRLGVAGEGEDFDLQL